VITLKFKHLSLEERERLYLWRELGVSCREIGRRLGRDHKTISKEIKRNTKYGKKYLPCTAQKRAERVGNKQRYKAPLKSPEIFLYVREHLRKPYHWTPEMISGHMKYDIKGISIDKETIYRYIYSKKAKKYKLWTHLPCGRSKRMKKNGRRVQNRGKVPNAVYIGLRPKIINDRKQFGHWETDNVESPRKSKPSLSVIVERKLRLVIITKIPNQTSNVKSKSLIKRLNNYPVQLRRSITQDNGKENYSHQNTTLKLGTKMYFCNPYHSWEKGAVENRNKIIRRFFPKGTDFAKISNNEVKYVENVINNMPLKCLKYKTAYEKLRELNLLTNH